MYNYECITQRLSEDLGLFFRLYDFKGDQVTEVHEKNNIL